ncbi:MAG TPA: ribosome-inactivating family protein [Actinocrinis sp.]|nr:ribosome-inactivating family protein [Actinocrinis sp.]
MALAMSLTALLGTGIGSASADTGTGHVTRVSLNIPLSGPRTANGAAYSSFLTALRAAAGHLYRGSTYVNQSSAGGLIRADVTMTGDDGNDPITLWINPENLYVLGFSNGFGETMYFNDIDQTDLTALNRAATAAGFNGGGAILPFASNYDNLSGAAGRGREATPISWNAISGAVGTLSNTRLGAVTGTAATNAARGLMLMIQLTSESARFTGVSSLFSTALTTSTSLGGLPLQQQYQENSWAAMSLFGTNITNQGSTPPVTITGAGPGASNLVLSTWSQVAAYLGILLGNFNLPTEGSGGNWAHTEL